MKNKSIFLILFTVLTVNLFGEGIHVVFRYDDFVLKNDSVNEAVERVFEQNHIPLVLGVIPCDSLENFILQKNYSFLPVLKSEINNQSIEISLHGLTHRQIIKGEFSNLSSIEQNRRIAKGKTFLDSIFQTKIISFIPPYNAYDDNTLQALNANGIKVISSALCTGQSLASNEILFAPETIEDFGTLLSVLNKNKNRSGVVVVMFHAYTFNNQFSSAKLDSILKSVNQLKFVNCYTFKGLIESNEKIDRQRINANMESNLLFKVFHLEGMIQTTQYSILIRIANFLVYLIMSLLVFFLSDKLVYRNRKNNRLVTIIALILVVLFSGLLVWYHVFAPLKLIPIVLAISMILMLLSKIKK